MHKSASEFDDAGHDKASRISRVLNGVAEQYAAGRQVDVGEIEREHPELMPELGVQLAWFARAQEAASAADRSSLPSPGASEMRAALQDELDSLRSAITGYEIIERIHQGGQGVVYKAIQQRTMRYAAVKLLLNGRPATAEKRVRFAREARIVSKLAHPHIVTIYESGVVQDCPFIAMEYVDGLRIDRHVLVEQLSVTAIVRLFIKICEAVGYAHQRGILHRDIKPSNILVDTSGEPHICDFGLAKQADGDEGWYPLDSVSVTGQVIGTLPYLSPEIARGKEELADVRSDIYALGIVLYQLLTTTFPYPVSGSAYEVCENIVSRDPVPIARAWRAMHAEPAPRELNNDLDAVVLKALAKDKNARYQSTAAFADDLRRYLSGDAVVAKTDNRLYVIRRTLRRYRLHFSIAALFLILAIASVAAITRFWFQARSERDTARASATLAHKTLIDTVTDVDDWMSTTAGATKYRDQVLAHIRESSRELKRLIRTDDALSDVLINLEEKQGDLESSAGRRLAASAHYESALAMLSRHFTILDEKDALLFRARLNRKLGAVSADPLPHFDASINAARNLSARTPSDTDATHELCLTLVARARHAVLNGQYKQAVPDLERAESLARTLLRDESSNSRWKHVIADSLEWRAEAWTKSGNSAKAIARLEETVELRSVLSSEDPANIVLRHNLFVTRSRLASAVRDSGESDRAVQLFEAAEADAEYLVAADPAVVQWRADLVATKHRLARLLIDAGELGQAHSLVDEAEALITPLVKVQPGNPEWKRRLAYAKFHRGLIQMSRQDYASARKELHSCLAQRRQLVDADPANASLQAEMAACLDRLAWCFKSSKDSEQAISYAARAYRARLRLKEANPDAVKYAKPLIASCITLANCHFVQITAEDNAAARRILERALETVSDLRSGGAPQAHTELLERLEREINKNLGRIVEQAKHEGFLPNESSPDIVSLPAPPQY